MQNRPDGAVCAGQPISALTWSLYKRPDGSLLALVSSGRRAGRRMNNYAYKRKFAAMLEAFEPFTRLDMIIGSAGGLVDSALGMESAVRDLKRPVRVLIDGPCISAATIVAFGVDAVDVQITRQSIVKVHNPYYQPRGGSGLLSLQERLQCWAVRNFMAKLYAMHALIPKKHALYLMRIAQSWRAEEAVRFGWASRITTKTEWMEAKP